MKNTDTPVARRESLVVQEVADEILIYDLSSNKAHCLNRTAAIVWRSCDGTNSVLDIAGLLGNAEANEDFVWLALEQLGENKLLDGQLPTKFTGLTRREAVRRLGLAAAVALPVVASLVAPPNALAVGSCSCVNPGACLTQTTCPSTVNCNGSGFCAP